MGWYVDRRSVEMPKVGFHRPPPVAEKQLETVHLAVACLALPTSAFQSCQGEWFPTVDVDEVFVERLYYVTDRLSWEIERVVSLPTLGPGLLAVSGYSHVRDALSHPEQRGKLLSLLKVRITNCGNMCLAALSFDGTDHTI